VSNPLRILQVLDRHLTIADEITLFGRSALALGFANAPPGFHNTRDVDAILSFQWLASKNEHLDFWLAQQATNAELSNDDLYLTHLFRESEVIIRPDWREWRVGLELPLQKLEVFRPAVPDLILTKMARGDEQDLEDIRFLLTQEPLSGPDLQESFRRARVPDLPEIRELFLAAQPKVLELAAGKSKE